MSSTEVLILRNAGADPVVFEGRHECGEFWYDVMDDAYAIQYAGTGRIIRNIASEAAAIRKLLGR